MVSLKLWQPHIYIIYVQSPSVIPATPIADWLVPHISIIYFASDSTFVHMVMPEHIAEFFDTCANYSELKTVSKQTVSHT
jgi:hypothetical protein